jgi:hypothetical protein
MFGSSPFENYKSSPSEIVNRTIQESDIIFVSDFFVEDYAGGAELTTEALIKASGEIKIGKVNSQHLSMDSLSNGVDKYWIFTNFAGMNKELIPAIIANLRYSIVEYDFKYCVFRSPEKHLAETGEKCNCHNEINGKMISAFFQGSNSIFWMSDLQKEVYTSHFPFLAKKRNILLTSVFSKEFFEKISAIDTSKKSETYIIVGSDSWIKGVDDSIAYCEKNNIKYEIVSNVTHDQMIEKMSTSKGMVFLPRGGDTCPRTVIEAKLLGCELIINENVMHKDESWFDTDDIGKTGYLLGQLDFGKRLVDL